MVMTINCAGCRKEIDQDRVIQRFLYQPNGQEYQLYHCSQCELDFWWPLEFYSKFYEEQLPEHEVNSMGYRPLSSPAKLFFELFPFKNGKLLDVGCGEGAFLEQAAKSGFDVWGIDLDAKGINAAKKVRGLPNVSESYLNKYAQKNNSSFNVVTFYEVLEHQVAPISFLENIKRCLKEGGYIAGSVPNRERILPGLHRASDLGDFPPAHFTRWSSSTLENFLKNQGFINVQIRSVGIDSVFDLVAWLRINILDHYNQVKPLKLLVSVMLLPFAMLMLPLFKKQSTQLYFQAQLNGGK